MSIENIEKFYAMAFKNPSMVEGLKTDGDPERFATLAVELGAANGCIFTTEEVGEWTKVKAVALQKNELDDQQLEAVAGGKGNPATFFEGLGKTLGGVALVSIGCASPGGLGAQLGVDGFKDMIHGAGG